MGQNIQALALCLWLQHIHSDLVLLSKKNSCELSSDMDRPQALLTCFCVTGNLVKLLGHMV